MTTSPVRAATELPLELLQDTLRALASGDAEAAFEWFAPQLAAWGVSRAELLGMEGSSLVRIAGEDAGPDAYILGLTDGYGGVGELRLELSGMLDDGARGVLQDLFGLGLGQRTRLWELELVRAAMGVNAAESLDASLAVLAETCCRLVGVPSANIAVWDQAFSVGTVRAGAGLSLPLVGEEVTAGSISHQATQSGAPVVHVHGGGEPQEGITPQMRSIAKTVACTLSVPLLLDGEPRITFQVDWLEDPSPATIERAISAIEKLEAVTSIAVRAEQERERSQHHDLLRAVIEAVPDGILIRHGDDMTVNAAMRRILRIREGKPFATGDDVNPRRLDGTPLPEEEWPSRICRRTGLAAEARFLSTIGDDELVLEYTTVPMQDGYVGVMRDVTEEHGEQVLTQHFLESLFESLPIGVGVADIATGEITSANPAMQRLLGLSREELVGLRRPYPWWGKDYDPDYFDSPEGTIETIYRRADGRPVPVELTPFHVHGVDGVPAWLVVLIRNTTERHEFERQLVHSGKLAAIGELASGVAHEINNPLFAILGLVEFLIRDTEEGTKAYERLTLIQQTGLEIKEIVRALLDFARERTDELRPLLLRDVVAETIDLIRRTSASKSIEIVENLDFVPAPILGSPNQIKQIILNLISNAQHAIGDTSGLITITVEAADADSVAVTVRDSGPGIAPAVLPRIFEPFFTTKRALGGTGLGLAVSHGIAEMHGGTLTAESEPGQGATFRLRLPLAAEETV